MKKLENYLREEIQIRLWRETIYKSLQSLNSVIPADKKFLQKEIEQNDIGIKLIGGYIRDKFLCPWEKFLTKKIAGEENKI